MTSRFTRIAAGTATALMAAGTLLAAPIAAHASTAPPWETGNPNAVGTIALYDASGHPVTSGNVTDRPIAAYAVGNAITHAGDTSAALFAYQPAPSTDPALFSGDQLSAYGAYPVSSAPDPVKSATGPVATGSANDLNVAAFVDEYPNTGPDGPGCRYETSHNPATCTNAAYENLYQLRLYSADSGGTRSTHYDVADILVTNATYSGGNITSGTWQLVYPSSGTAPTATSTTVSAAPHSPVPSHTSVTLTAKVAGADSSKPAGSVRFKVNGSSFGSAVPVNTSTGLAQLTTRNLPVGTDHIGATFTPSDSAAYQSSGAAAITYTVKPAVLRNVKAPKLSGKGRVGRTEKVKHGTWSPTPSHYRYQWLLNGKAIRHATKASFHIPGADKGKKLSCRVTASKRGYKRASKTTKSIKVKG